MLRVEHVTKSFGPITALRDINLHLRKGEVLGLLGDNGAGKSTLIKILCGFHKPDSGSMWLKGEPYAPKSVLDARTHGIDTVYQDLALIDELTVYHNLFLRREEVMKPIPFLANRKMRKARERHWRRPGSTSRGSTCRSRVSPEASARRSRSRGRSPATADVILLDEPLAAMGAKEGALILDLIARLKAEGNLSIIMILHNYVHVFAGLRSREPDPGRSDRARQADERDERRRAQRDRRRGVPARAAGSDGRGSGRRHRPSGDAA